MAMIREKIRDELPTLLKLYRADKFLVNKIVASATAFFDEVRNDPKHPFRGEFDRMVLSLRRPARQRPGLCRPYRRLEARPAGAARTRRSRRATSGRMRDPSSSAAPAARRRCCSSISPACSSRRARRWPAMPSCAARSTRVWSRCCAVSSPIRRAASRASSPIRSRPGTWAQLISLIEINIGQRPAIHPLQRLADRRACRSCALHAGIPAAVAVTNCITAGALRAGLLSPWFTRLNVGSSFLAFLKSCCVAERFCRVCVIHDPLAGCRDVRGRPRTGDTMSAAAQTLRPPSRTLMFLEGRAIHEFGAFLGALPLLSLAPRGDGHPVLVLPGLVASDTSTRPLRSFLKSTRLCRERLAPGPQSRPARGRAARDGRSGAGTERQPWPQGQPGRLEPRRPLCAPARQDDAGARALGDHARQPVCRRPEGDQRLARL